MTRYDHPGQDFTISTDARHLNLDVLHAFLSRQAYWSKGIPREILERAIANSLNFGLYEGDPESRRLVGFARVVTDRATFAWLCDVFIAGTHRGRGLGKLLIGKVMAHPELRGLRNFLLATRDAHGLYARYGFAPLAEPGRWMAIRKTYRADG